MTIGDSQNLIAPCTIIREMCPDHSVKSKNLIFGYFQDSILFEVLRVVFEKMAESRPPIVDGVFFLEFF